jgi:tetratricopeptide (TPR) repeat protein
MYRTAIRNSPGSFDAQMNLANAYYGAKMYDDAIESYRSASNIKPMDSSVYYLTGVALRDKNSFQEAASSFDRATQLNGGYHQAFYELGMIYYRNIKDKQKAIANFEKVLSIKPDHPDADKIRNIISMLKGQ